MLLSIKIALKSLKAHKLRTVLAMLGIFLGALALTGVQHISLAMVKKAEQETEKLGPNLLMARSGSVRMRRSGSARVSNEARNFTLADAKAVIYGLPSALAGSPFVSTTMPIRHGNRKTNCQLTAVTPEYSRVRSFKPEYGRFLTQKHVDDLAMVCVLGKTIAERLFGRPEAAVGESVLFYRAECRVIGVMETKGSDITGANQDEQVFVPVTTYMRRFANQDWISGVYVQLAPRADPDQAKSAAEEILRARHKIGPGQEDDFTVMTAKETMQLQKQALDLVRTLGLISSSVSFAVGGLGVLSIMVLLVHARRLEIGIRRSVGARRRDIVGQFLLEAGLLSGIGGALGVAGALVLVVVVYAAADFPLTFDPQLVFLALCGSALLGVAAGAYPAWKASRIEILEVLKNKE